MRPGIFLSFQFQQLFKRLINHFSFFLLQERKALYLRLKAAEKWDRKPQKT